MDHTNYSEWSSNCQWCAYSALWMRHGQISRARVLPCWATDRCLYCGGTRHRTLLKVKHFCTLKDLIRCIGTQKRRIGCGGLVAVMCSGMVVANWKPIAGRRSCSHKVIWRLIPDHILILTNKLLFQVSGSDIRYISSCGIRRLTSITNSSVAMPGAFRGS